ncbi:ABC transporter substrate-binding protein [Roseococcus suduntuyensis]|uniref:Branched-chain amino acid transport system substrate-binding protein n=1 Tax=Roseococcus suduntuyensis TaxID=455361 RepID=A0A840AGP1_9PROT|nr:ABC transporter substrate-binding protein [Roseococcus suduntuyensis]MBB3899723.1 branched-chain amino acid transport system substrate-binding protein [Roseococcus suduntuyensis]
MSRIPPFAPRRALLGLGVLAGLALGAAAPAAAQRAQPCIGASWELTGPLAHTGLSIRIAVETAIEEINAAGGVLGQPLRLIAYDDQGEPARAVDNARRIGERDNCIVMMGGFRTPNAIALREPLDEMGLPWMGVISAGTGVIEHPNNANRWMFRVSMKDRWVAPFLVDAARARSASGRIALVYEGTAWGQGAIPDVTAAMRAANIPLAGQETFNIADTDMSAQLIRLRDAGVDTIIFYGVDREATNLLRSMDRLGYRPQIVSAWGVGVQFAQTAGPLANGVIVAGTYTWMGELPPRAAGVLQRIQARFPQIRTAADIPLPSGTANAYDATFIIAEAIKLAGRLDREAFREALFRVNYQGIVANYAPAFERRQERHDAIQASAYQLFAFHDGQLLPIAQTPYGRARTN